MFLLIKKST